jgi:hypothetical protein
LNQFQDPEFKHLREKTKQMEDRLFTHMEVDPATLSFPTDQQVMRAKMGKVDQDAIIGIKQELAAGVPAEEINRLNQKARNNKALSLEEKAILDREKAKNRIVKELKLHQYKYEVPPGKLDLDSDLDFNTLEISVFNATNKPASPDKIGFDRDITYQVIIPEKTMVVKMADGTHQTIKVPAKKIDIPAQMAEVHYNKSLYTNLNSGKLIPSQKTLKQYGEDMDHAVTDYLDREAYKLNVDKIENFFKYPHLIKDSRIEVENFGSTVIHKSEEWFTRARESAKHANEATALAQTAEGMRQAAKQYENYMVKLLDYYQMSEAIHIAPKLKNGIHIFNGVRKGKISVSQAEDALASIGTTKEEVVQFLGDTFESIVKFGIKTKK